MRKIRVRTLVLFLYQFPYRTSEPFMETEIEYLSQKFEKIIIFSVNIHQNESPSRKVPPNVEVYPIFCPNNKAKNILKGLFFHGKEFPIFKRGLKKGLANAYVFGRMLRITEKAYPILLTQKCNIQNSVFYSYWFNLTLPLYLLRKRFDEAGVFNIKLVSRAHGYDLYQERNAVGFLPFQQESLNFLSLVAPCSQDGVLYLRKRFPQTAARIEIARLGTRRPRETPVLEFDNGETFKIITCSRFRKLKRLDLFARAFKLLLARFPKTEWICIGDGEESQSLFDLFSELGIRQSIILKGRLSNQEVLDFYQGGHYDLFVNVSSCEGVPVSIMEAMSFGIPCIATNVGGTSEIVENSFGRLIDSSIDESLLSEIIASELSLPLSERIEKRRNAYHVWETKCSAEFHYRAWAETINGL